MKFDEEVSVARQKRKEAGLSNTYINTVERLSNKYSQREISSKRLKGAPEPKAPKIKDFESSDPSA